MITEDKNLLLEDLCARLPYGVKVQMADGAVEELLNVNVSTFICNGLRGLPKPYLFPLSSMSEEQKKYINDRWGINEDFDFEIDPNWGKYFIELGDVVGFINWSYENHLDINDLILQGLAIDATNKNIY